MAAWTNQTFEVTFLSYNDTLEDIAWSLIGKKLYAAQLLYGDEVGGAIVESDDGDFLTELTRSAVDGVKVDDLTRLFATASAPAPARTPMPAPRLPASRPERSRQRVTFEQMRALVGASPRRSTRRVVPIFGDADSLLRAAAELGAEGKEIDAAASAGQMDLFG